MDGCGIDAGFVAVEFDLGGQGCSESFGILVVLPYPDSTVEARGDDLGW